MSDIHSPRYQYFLKQLKKAREDAQLTPKDVAKHFGKPQSYISKSESGEHRVDVIELVAFARLYHKPITFFVPPEQAAG